MNPFSPAIFSEDIGCLPCCNAPFRECECALLIPPPTPIGIGLFPSYTDALDSLTQFSADCLVWNAEENLADTFTADNSTPDTLTVSIDYGEKLDSEIYASISMKSGSVLTVAWSSLVNTSGSAEVFWRLRSCDWSTILASESITSAGASGSFSTYTVLSDGEFIITFGGSYDSADWSISSDDTMLVNPVIALWDEGGDPRKLEACPKMYTPTGGETSGIWYPDLSTAQDVVSGSWYDETNVHILTVDCLAVADYSAPDPDQTTTRDFSASGTTSLDLSYTRVTEEPGDNAVRIDASINLIAGSTLSVAWDVDLSWTGSDGDLTVTVSIVRAWGGGFQTLTDFPGPGPTPLTGSGTFVFDPVDATERYSIRFQVDGFPGNTSGTSTLTGSFNVTSDDTMSVNPVQALYDAGLDCPARINCT